ncbi:MAG TPA: transcription elongation factor GreB [Pseudomonadales bacterium]|nr:transcription elongation factor GreB [Pseudomonadales bacterium]
MSRYRPPREKSSPFITPLGQRRLSDELKDLWKVKRPEVTRKVAEAAALGDRSENAEYIYGKKMLREMDARIRFLSKRLDELVVVDRIPPDRTRVYFGAWVTLEDDDGAEFRYRIVGADEFDRVDGYISIDSPMARAMLKKSRDDEVVVQRPDGVAHYTITEIHYDDPLRETD